MSSGLWTCPISINIGMVQQFYVEFSNMKLDENSTIGLVYRRKDCMNFCDAQLRKLLKVIYLTS
jgi:ABC-type sugar transport system ATPase subunit